ncbi:MAG TPA: peptidylprolyl isomerase [Polyangiaceae bacterium]|nr:peptidylprolyl isomerase [Polyangiaceae bacterium]
MAPSSRRSTPLRRVLCAGGIGVAFLSWSLAGNATVIERIVAVVGEQAILLSELRDRARPFLLRMEQQPTDQAQRAAATSELYRRLVQRLVEEELEQKAANRSNITVTPREIDEALQRIAQQNGVAVSRIMDEAISSGLTEQSYRQELRRQLLETKMLNLRIQGRMRVTEDDTRGAYQRLVVDERKTLGFGAAWIRISAPHSSSAAELKDHRAEAERIVTAARRGEDFAVLARRYSEDTGTRAQGGSLGQLKPGQLPAALDAVALSLDVGEISEPVRSGNDFVILKLVSRDESQLPAYDEARDELSNRVYMEKMNKARTHWIDGLRRQTHVEVRL